MRVEGEVGRGGWGDVMEEEGEGGGGSCATRQNEQTRGTAALKGEGSAGGACDRCFVFACRRKKGREEDKKGGREIDKRWGWKADDLIGLREILMEVSRRRSPWRWRRTPAVRRLLRRSRTSPEPVCQAGRSIELASRPLGFATRQGSRAHSSRQKRVRDSRRFIRKYGAEISENQACRRVSVSSLICDHLREEGWRGFGHKAAVR